MSQIEWHPMPEPNGTPVLVEKSDGSFEAYSADENDWDWQSPDYYKESRRLDALVPIAWAHITPSNQSN